MNIINYDEIKNLLAKFQSLRENSNSNNENAISSLRSYFNSGINFGGLLGSSESLISKVNNSSSVLDADYDRIIKFLTKLAEEAEKEHNKQITTLDATEIWKVQEATRG